MVIFPDVVKLYRIKFIMSLMSLRVGGREMCDIVNEGQNYLSLFKLLLQLEREIIYYKARFVVMKPY